jgi:hypothetical protein
MPVFALWLRLALTVALVVSGGYCLRRCGSRQARPIYRLHDATHVLMSLEMIAMAWAVAVPDPLGIQIVGFGIAAVWFAVQATGVPLRRAALLPAAEPAHVNAEKSSDTHGPPPRTQCLHYAALLAVMIWMVVAVRPSAMEMSRPSTEVADVLGAYCLVVALGWAMKAWWPVARALPPRFANAAAGTHTGIAMSYVGMTAAMGVMLIAMR